MPTHKDDKDDKRYPAAPGEKPEKKAAKKKPAAEKKTSLKAGSAKKG